MNLNVDNFLEMYQSRNIEELSTELGINTLKLADWMKENSIKLKKQDIGLINHLRQSIHISKEELYQKFIVENMTRKQTAEYFGVSEALIKKKCSIYGIKKDKNKYLKNTNKTLLEKYGTTNIRVALADKIEKTNLKKYGARTPFHSVEVQKELSKIKNHLI